MITIGYNQVQEKHVADSNSNAREAKKVYVGNKLAHVHVNDNTEFALRQTLNGYIHEDNDLYARVRSIRGNTKVWNQLVQNPTFVDTSEWQSYGIAATLSASNNEVHVYGNLGQTASGVGIQQSQLIPVVGHKYAIKFELKLGNDATHTSITYRLGIDSTTTTVSNTYNKYSNIITATNNKFLIIWSYLVEGGIVDFYLKDINIYDLTLIYGAGNEPTTVAEFEADFQQWFGRPLGAEPYDAGSLIPFIGTGIKSTGFNLWDEEWEVGTISGANGQDTINSNGIRSVGYTRVFPNTLYHVDTRLAVMFYDSAKNFISYVSEVESCTTPSNCAFIRFATRAAIAYGPTYNNDICINFSNPTLNGTYVPYKATTVPIPVTTLTGKAEGSSTSEVIFPDGMKSAGSIKDEVYIENGKTYAIKRVGNRDMGTLNWVASAANFFYAEVSDMKQPITNSDRLNGIVCSKYPVDVVPAIDETAIDKTFKRRLSYIYVRDTSYTDATTFKTAMSGVMLYYELATPIVYEVDNYTLPLHYIANGTGTEELQSTATTAPADMDIEYRLRKRVRLVDMGTPGVLWADSDIDITKPDGFCDSAFTYEKSFFSWGNVVGHNPISNTAFDYDWGGINQAEPWYEGQVYGSTPGNTLTNNIPADAQYDAAKAVLGGNWRMPSNSDFNNLFSVCKFLEADGSDMDTSKTDKRVDMPNGNGGTVKGIYIESTVTGNRLFFSCSGNGTGRSRGSLGSIGYYWSSTRYSARDARVLYFYSGGVSPQGNGNRYYGFAVRPVFPISQ